VTETWAVMVSVPEAEVEDARKVAVINQTLARRYFASDDPLGRQIKLAMLETFPTPPVPNPVFEIVGVVADAKNNGIQQQPVPEAFIPYTIVGNYERFLTTAVDNIEHVESQTLAGRSVFFLKTKNLCGKRVAVPVMPVMEI
jgi:hypothetical protein